MITLEIIIYSIAAIMFLWGFSLKIYAAYMHHKETIKYHNKPFSKLAKAELKERHHYADMLMATSVTIAIITILTIYYW